MPTLRAQQKLATRALLFDVAMRLFERDGYDSVNVDDIVRESGVARGTFYFHYESKEDVLYEAVRRGEVEISARMAAVSLERPLREVLQATCDGFADLWGSRRDFLGEAGSVGMRRIVAAREERENEPLRLELAKHVERALGAGELRSTLPAQMLADVFLLDVFAALMAWAATGVPDLPTVMAGMIELFLRGAEGFGTPPPPPKAKRGPPRAARGHSSRRK